MQKPSRIIIDTNLWISFLITKDIKQLDRLIFSNRVRLLFSQELLDEFLAVASRPKFKRWFSPSEVALLLETIQAYADFVSAITTPVNVCRDTKDNFLLSLAVDGKADFLITGDKDLLDLRRYRRTAILTISDFLTYL